MNEQEIRDLAGRMNPDNWRCDVCGQKGGGLVVEVPKGAMVEFERGEGEGEIVPKVPKYHSWCKPQHFDSENN